MHNIGHINTWLLSHTCLTFCTFSISCSDLHDFINKKTLPPNRIIVPSEESDDDMVGSSDSEMDISIESARVGSVEESFISEEGKENK